MDSLLKMNTFSIDVEDGVVYCEKCGDELEMVELGHVCLDCGLFVGECHGCTECIWPDRCKEESDGMGWHYHTYFSASLIAWTVLDNVPDGAVGYVGTPIEELIGYKINLYRNLNEKADIKWYKPPYLSHPEGYIDETTMWVFKCNKCSKYLVAHCD